MRNYPVILRGFLTTLFAFCLLVNLAGGATAHASPVVAEVVGAGQNQLSVALAQPVGNSGNATKLQGYLASNLKLVPFVKLVNAAGIPGGGAVGPDGKVGDFKPYLMAGVDRLVTAYWVADNRVEIRTYSTADGKLLFGFPYNLGGGGDAVYDVADKFCGDFLEATIGSGAFFRSTLAFVKSSGPQQRDIWATKANGRHLRQLSHIKGQALSPTWSPDGRYVLFSHIDYRSHGLGVWDAATNSVRRVRFPGNTVIGPSYFPDGRVAVSLTDGRNPSIFMLDHSFNKVRKLDESYGIDVSPSIDASGTKMVFTSSRMGGPQIFLKDLRTGAVNRISAAGNYNTDPSISPDGTSVAFARRMAGGHRIFVRDLVTGQERQISHGPGSDEEPAFAPDSYFVAFMSTRNGKRQVFLTTRYGGQATALPTGPGDAAFPSWGAAR